jgi:hypothetical protein
MELKTINGHYGTTATLQMMPVEFLGLDCGQNTSTLWQRENDSITLEKFCSSPINMPREGGEKTCIGKNHFQALPKNYVAFPPIFG